MTDESKGYTAAEQVKANEALKARRALKAAKALKRHVPGHGRPTVEVEAKAKAAKGVTK